MQNTWEIWCDAVLAGSLAVDTVEGVPPWPPEGACAGSVAVLMFRGAPGAVGMVGRVHGRRFMAVTVSDRLAKACREQRAGFFDPVGPMGLVGSEIALCEALWASLDGEAVPLIQICGAEAAALLRDLRASGRGALH